MIERQRPHAGMQFPAVTGQIAALLCVFLVTGCSAPIYSIVATMPRREWWIFPASRMPYPGMNR